MATGSLIRQSYFSSFTNEKMDELRHKQKVQELLEYNKKNKDMSFLIPPDSLIPLTFYLTILENTDSVMFHYMSPQKKNQQLRDLQVTYLLLLTQKEYELQHQKSENLKTYDKHLKQCQQFIDKLQYEQVCEERQTRPAPEHGAATEGTPVAYLGIDFGQAFAEQMANMADRKSKTLVENMSAANEKRLYWVWGSALLKSTLELMPANFFNTDQAKLNIRAPDPYTGTISWVLYYFRFAVNLGLLLKHTIGGPWMSDEEKKTPWTERFQTQWAQRKFTLLNDALWATGNLLTFIWLIGSGALGASGDVLTIALLVFDISVAVWDYEEQKTKYNKEMLDYDTNIKELKLKKEQLQDARKAAQTQKEKEEQAKQMNECLVQLHALERAQKHCKREWTYSKLNLINNISYAVGLMLAYVLLTMPFMPIASAALATIGVAGAILCFAFTVISNAVKGAITIHKTRETAKEAKEDYAIKIGVFKGLMLRNPDLNDNEKRLLFLEIKKLKAETSYQNDMVVLQTMHLIRSVLLEALIPAIVFVSFVFLPLGIGLAALGTVLVFALISNWAIDEVFKPEKKKLADFKEEEYLAFCKNVDKLDQKAEKSSQFFQPGERDSTASPGDSNDLDSPILN